MAKKMENLNDNFKDFKKKRIEYDIVRSKLQDEFRKAEIEEIGAELKKRILVNMLGVGGFTAMSRMQSLFYTENTLNEVKYSVLAEGAALAANYFRDNGFKVDVRWDDANPAKGSHRAVIHFEL